MMPIIKWTWRQRRQSTLWWSIGLVAFILLTLVFYPSFRDQAAQFEKTFADLPKAAVQLFGGSSDFFSPIGYLNSQITFIMLPLLFSMLAVSLGASLIAREEQDQTIEMLLTRPISRSHVLAAKAAAGTLILATVSLITTIVMTVMAHLVKIDVPSSAVFLAGFNCFLLAWCTGAIAFLLAATGRARGAAIGISGLVGVGGYLIDSLAGTINWLKVPAHVLPFHYYQSEAILRQTYHWVNGLFFVSVLAVCGILSYIAFRRRDLG
jgi:ABC-2 type transport system permease protein